MKAISESGASRKEGCTVRSLVWRGVCSRQRCILMTEIKAKYKDIKCPGRQLHLVKLFCAIVGEVGSAFPVVISESESVGGLKDAIKDKNKETITCDAKDLVLFLAMTTDGAWLTSKNPLMCQIREGELPPEVVQFYMNEELDDPTDKISTILPSEIPMGRSTC